jgi:hypothetical protein
VVFDAYFPRAAGDGHVVGLGPAERGEGERERSDDASDRRPGLDGGDAHSLLPPALGAARPAAPGDRWRFNLYRLDLPDRKNAQGQAFSPLFVGDFHAVDRFAWLVFEG